MPKQQLPKYYNSGSKAGGGAALPPKPVATGADANGDGVGADAKAGVVAPKLGVDDTGVTGAGDTVVFAVAACSAIF